MEISVAVQIRITLASADSFGSTCCAPSEEHQPVAVASDAPKMKASRSSALWRIAPATHGPVSILIPIGG